MYTPLVQILNVSGQNATVYPTMHPATAGNAPAQNVDPKLNYNPATGILSVNRVTFNNVTSGPNHLPQSIQTYFTTPTSQAFSASITGEVAGLSASIVPKSVNSKIFITVRWMGEFSNDTYVYNSMWGLRRNSAAIGAPVDSGVRIAGMQTATQSYIVADNNSTPETMNFTYLDSPATTSVCTYTVTFLSYSGLTMYTNRTVGDTNAKEYERGTSCITLLEVA